MKRKIYLITGVAGFIGSNLAKKILNEKNNYVIGIDNLNEFYDIELKKHRLEQLYVYNNFKFIKSDISKKSDLEKIFKEYKPKFVINLAAQAGVRLSLINPEEYIQSNLLGFFNVLECCKNYEIEHLIFASSSSVYGDNNIIPYSIESNTDKPISLYAATKKSNEVMAYSYSSLYKIKVTGLRFFSVYGPEGRPDMAYFKFTNKLVNRDKIQIYNYGMCERDFTYIDDVIDVILKIIKNKNSNLYKIYNIGKGKSENLLEFVNILKEELIKEKILPIEFDINEYIEYSDKKQGDVVKTCADIKETVKELGYKPKTTLREGLNKFAKWYKKYYM